MTLLPVKASRPPFANHYQAALWAWVSIGAISAKSPAVALIPASGGNPAVPAVKAGAGIPTFLKAFTFGLTNLGLQLKARLPLVDFGVRGIYQVSGGSLYEKLKPISALTAPTVTFPITGTYALPDEPFWVDSLEKFFAWNVSKLESRVRVILVPDLGMLDFIVDIPFSEISELSVATLATALPAGNENESISTLMGNSTLLGNSTVMGN